MTSVRSRLFLGISGLIALFVLITFILNANFLTSYYYYTKRNALARNFKEINRLCEGDAGTLQLKLEQLEQGEGLRISLMDRNFQTIYDTNKMRVRPLPVPKLFRERGSATPSLRIMILSGTIKLKENTYIIKNTKDDFLGRVYVSLIGQLKNGNYLLLRTPVAAIDESAKTANRFSLFSGLIMLVAGSTFAYSFSRKFTQPILEIKEIAQRMSQLDFSEKYQVKTEDEIGALGNSINLLSQQLEHSIHELRGANDKLKDDIHQKQLIDDMRKEFIANVSHELKTPIALIQGFSEGLRLNVHEDEQNKDYYCEVIIDEAHKMDRLVRQLLNLSQIESGGQKPEKSDFDICSLIDNVLKKSSILLQDKGINVAVDGEKSLMVSADMHMTEQVLTNYLMNAIKHVDKDRLIKFTAEAKGKKAKVSVFNTGSNIPRELADLIWTSFYKADKARNRDSESTGLGLSIAKAIQDAHGNHCGFDNLDGGVSFWFELDLA